MAPQTQGQARKAEEDKQTLMPNLQNTHKFREKSGITSCATTTLEYYCLRVVELTRNLASIVNIIPLIQALQLSRALNTDAVRDTDTFRREKMGAFETKREHIKEELEHALSKYIELFYQRLYSDLYELPLELRQIIYEYLLDTSRHLKMLRFNPTTFSNASMSRFWGTVSTKDVIRHIEISIPRFKPLKEPHMLDEIRFQMSALKSLKPDKVAIHLTIMAPRYQTMTKASVTTAAYRACAKTQRPMSQGWRDMMDEGVARDVKRMQEDREWNLRVVMGVLLPDLAFLVRKQYEVKLKGQGLDWEYSLCEENLTINDMMKGWRESVGDEV